MARQTRGGSMHGKLFTALMFFSIPATAATAQEVLTTATPEVLVRSLDPIRAQTEKTRGLKIVGAKELETINSYGDKLAATVNLAVNFTSDPPS